MGECAIKEIEKMLLEFTRKLDAEGFMDSDIRISEIKDVIDDFLETHFRDED